MGINMVVYNIFFGERVMWFNFVIHIETSRFINNRGDTNRNRHIVYGLKT